MKFLTLVLSLLTFSRPSFGQSSDSDFGELLQTYYLHKNVDIVNKAIDFINHTSMNYEQLEPMLTGFFGALFSKNANAKAAFAASHEKISRADVKQLMIRLTAIDIDKLYLKLPINPSYNDMNWASYFATGNVKYLDNIVYNIYYKQNRDDINLFLAGATAEWSLCSNAKQDAGVKKYLNSIKEKNEEINKILQSEPEYFKEEMNGIVNKQRQKGIWN